MIVFKQETKGSPLCPPTTVEMRIDCEDLSAPQIIEYFGMFMKSLGYEAQMVDEMLGAE